MMVAGGPDAAAMVRLGFPGLTSPVALPAEVCEVLSACLHGWQPLAAPPAAPPLSRIDRQGQGYRFASPSLAEPMTGLSPVGAVCALIADLAQARSEAPDMLMGVHCAALEIDGRLVVLAGPARAGKTTLATRLALEPGVRLFCDDVLPVRPDGQGMALGIAPRLRLPVPEGAGAALAGLVASHTAASDDRYAYVDVPGQAAHGSLAPLGAIVMLDRTPGQQAELGRMSDDAGVRLMLAQAITRADSPAAALDQALRLMQGLPALRLRFDRLDDGASLLAAAMADPDRLPALPDAPPPVMPPPHGSPVALHQTLARMPGVERRGLSGGAFLWRSDEAELWHLNPVADAVWTLLEVPGSAAQIAEVLSELFPQVPPPDLESDVMALLGGLCTAGLVRPAI